jgi:murein DD-endopeptidase MepM/ murein hydrolase activator NlpD
LKPFGGMRAALVAALALLVCGVTEAGTKKSGTKKAVTKAASEDSPTVDPGAVVRWSVPGTTRCGMAGRSWPALDQTCYYPVDVEHKPGAIAVVRRGPSSRETARITVGPSPYGTEEIDLGDIPQAHPSEEDKRRHASEQARLARVFRRKEGPALFTLPLQAPAEPLPEGKTFGWMRIFNGVPATQPHMGVDYALTEGTPLVSAADGTVVIAEDLFYPGNAVIVDHGDGLFTMYFHLSEIAVEAGQEVKRGDRVGSVGTTGRSTGPHLFYGARWHDARIDPQYLLGDPARIPPVENLTAGKRSR